MCGICGKLTYDGEPVHEAQIESMRRAIAHRGPDDRGVHCHQAVDSRGRRVAVGLGHARLSVIDLTESGHQPMGNEDGSVWIVFNGEIYNYRSLRDALKKNGHRFQGESDTEVVLHLYEEAGLEAVRALNGMFAFALWDQRIPRLWLCRDRLGIKPLIYSWNGQELVFGSEIKSLIQVPGQGRAGIDFEALELYLAFGYVPAPYTIFNGIRKLEPGHSLVFSDGRLEKTRYWELPRPHKGDQRVDSSGDSFVRFKNRLYDTLTEAVTSQMIADVPLGAFLSGGIDSSIVTAIMARHSDRPIQTFSVGFKDDHLYDETRYAREMARFYRTDHHECKISEKDMFDVFPRVLSSFDEPFADSSAIPSYIVSMHTRRHVKVALSGDGGDELFAGYRSYLGEYWRPAYMTVPGVVRRVIEQMVKSLPDSRDKKWMEYVRRIKKFINAAYGDYPQRLLSLKEVIPWHLRADLMLGHPDTAKNGQPDIALNWVRRLIEQYDPAIQKCDPAIQKCENLIQACPADRINALLYTDIADSLPGDMLNKVDWMSMQHALEVRVPFLDHRVVSLACEMPGELKLKGFTTKYVLRAAFGHLLPESLLRRPKSGFEVPISRWLKTDLGFLIDQYLSRERIASQKIFDYSVIDRMKADFRQNRTDTSWMLWNLIVFQYWYEAYGIG